MTSGFYHEDHRIELNKDGFSVVKGFKGFAGLTGIEKLREHAGYDLCDVTVDYSLGSGLPNSFPGYSGGGLWNVTDLCVGRTRAGCRFSANGRSANAVRGKVVCSHWSRR